MKDGGQREMNRAGEGRTGQKKQVKGVINLEDGEEYVFNLIAA